MVTHDVGLKYFADRIIWLRDGKIQRVEHVSASKREETMRNLRQELHDLGLDGSVSIANDDANVASSQALEPSPLFKNTQIRRPSDYRTHKNFSSDNAVTLSNFSN